jgi:PAS domain-containing protein
MTWVYENVTERLNLESRYNALIRNQGETLDHLAEGVAVCGSDGRLRLHNPALADIWELEKKNSMFTQAFIRALEVGGEQEIAGFSGVDQPT